MWVRIGNKPLKGEKGDPGVGVQEFRSELDEIRSTVMSDYESLRSFQKWSPTHTYGPQEPAFHGGTLYATNPWYYGTDTEYSGVPEGVSPSSYGEYEPDLDADNNEIPFWVPASGSGGNDAALAYGVSKNTIRINKLWAKVFETLDEGIQFNIDFDTLDGLDLRSGYWNETLGRIEC